MNKIHAAAALLAAFSFALTACSGSGSTQNSTGNASASSAATQASGSTQGASQTERKAVTDPEKDQPVSCMTGGTAEKTEFANLQEAWQKGAADRFACAPVYNGVQWKSSGRNSQEEAALKAASDAGSAASLGDLYTTCASPAFGIDSLSATPSANTIGTLQGAVTLCPNHPDAQKAKDFIAQHPAQPASK
ncbi:Uncharacterised protein [Actinobaculum suis]|uniref:DUF732 domain-containing protein n=1 Tax=Actinobaculum suis TaxID=1657 RepID=A0A7Z8Y9V6_9ACTO|nr:hypothetical protein [Actinobaculum suis]VDG76657.1 Uncharacterised protein [Actinobaculum suis]